MDRLELISEKIKLARRNIELMNEELRMLEEQLEELKKLQKEKEAMRSTDPTLEKRQRSVALEETKTHPIQVGATSAPSRETDAEHRHDFHKEDTPWDKDTTDSSLASPMQESVLEQRPASEGAAATDHFERMDEPLRDKVEAKEEPSSSSSSKKDSGVETVASDPFVENDRATSIKDTISLADFFYLQNELYGGSSEFFESDLRFMEALADYDKAVEHILAKHREWDIDDSAVKRFLEILRNYFNGY